MNGNMAIMVLTRAPGVGKTTVVTTVAWKLQEPGVKVGINNNSMSIGFEILLPMIEMY